MLSASRRNSTSHTKLRLSDIETEDFMVNTCVHCTLFDIEQETISGYLGPDVLGGCLDSMNRIISWRGRLCGTTECAFWPASDGTCSYRSPDTTMEDLTDFRHTWWGLAWSVTAATGTS
jgi:hypothetical protein